MACGSSDDLRMTGKPNTVVLFYKKGLEDWKTCGIGYCLAKFSKMKIIIVNFSLH